MDWNQLWTTVQGWISSTGIKIVIALLILVITFRIITVVTRRIEKKSLNGKKPLDKTLTVTLMKVVRIVLKSLVVVCLVGYLGIDTSGITALIASLGVCAGLAVNGALSNLAGGVLIIITRPFKVDDFIETCGYSGTVEDIKMTQTKLRTPDNKVVYIPNGTLSSAEIINYSEKDVRRLDLTFSISYSEDFERAKSVIIEVASAHEKVLQDPQPFARISEHGASSINIATRVWVKSEDYWDVNFDLLEAVKKAFDQQNIEIPFNQLDVHVIEQKNQ